MASDRQPAPAPATPDYPAIVRTLLDTHRQLVNTIEGLLPPAAPVQPGFIPSAFQRGILDALAGKALRTDALAAKVGSRSRLFADPGGLPELQEEGLVSYHPRVGYYRPDA